MTYVKNGAMILLVDDSEVQKYTMNGFETFELPKLEEPEETKRGKRKDT